MKALLIIDVQNDFMPGGALAVKEGDQVIPVINELLKQKWDIVVASKDWHPQRHGSFASSHGKKPGEQIELDGVMQILWPDHCIEHEQGAELHPGLDQKAIHYIVLKGTDPSIDSYSAFFDNQKKRATGLHEYLQKYHVDELYVVGLATDYCVKYTVLDALELGYKVSVVEKGCRAVNLHPDDEEKAWKEMKEKGAKLCQTQ